MEIAIKYFRTFAPFLPQPRYFCTAATIIGFSRRFPCNVTQQDGWFMFPLFASLCCCWVKAVARMWKMNHLMMENEIG